MAVSFSDPIIAGTTVHSSKHAKELLDAVNKIADSVKYDINRGQARPSIATNIIEYSEDHTKTGRWNSTDIGNIRNGIISLENSFSNNCDCAKNLDCCQTCQRLSQCKSGLVVGTSVSLKCQIQLCETFTQCKECSSTCQSSTCQSISCQSIIQCSCQNSKNQGQCACENTKQCSNESCQKAVQCCQTACQTKVQVNCNNQNQCSGNQTCQRNQSCQSDCYSYNCSSSYHDNDHDGECGPD